MKKRTEPEAIKGLWLILNLRNYFRQGISNSTSTVFLYFSTGQYKDIISEEVLVQHRLLKHNRM